MDVPKLLSLANNALAIQISFPTVGAAQTSFSSPDLPASLGKKKPG